MNSNINDLDIFFISGWKNIGAFMGISERSARRLELFGLPVRRLPGNNRILAIKVEIVLWLQFYNELRAERLKCGQERPGTVRNGQI